MRGITAPVMRTVEMMSYHLTVPSTLSALTLVKAVAKNEVTKEMRIPTAVIMRGKYMALAVARSS
jgi:hypothetical protein